MLNCFATAAGLSPLNFFNMAYLSYMEQLKDPRWQEKRILILQRDNLTCQWCGSTDKQLHIHHFTYGTGAMAWEAPDEDLVTICCDCHYLEHIKTLTPVEAKLYEIIRSTAQSKVALSELNLKIANDFILKHKNNV